jgi:hypothetical protein
MQQVCHLFWDAQKAEGQNGDGADSKKIDFRVRTRFNGVVEGVLDDLSVNFSTISVPAVFWKFMQRSWLGQAGL